MRACECEMTGFNAVTNNFETHWMESFGLLC